MSAGSLTVRSRECLHRPIGELIVPEVQVQVGVEAVGAGQLAPDPQPAAHPGSNNREDAYRQW